MTLSPNSLQGKTMAIQGARLATLALLLVAAVASPDVAAQKIYQWVDEHGNTQFTQTPPPEGIKTESREMAQTVLTDERRAYCAEIRGLAARLSTLRRQGMSGTTASESIREVEVSEGLDVSEVALRELVNFVFAGGRQRDYDIDVSGRAHAACIGGSFGKLGRTLAKAGQAGGAKKPAAAGKEAPRGTSTGTGWITHGLIATNYHVIKGHHDVKVRFANGREATAFVGDYDETNDVALLRVGGQLPPGLPLAGGEASIGADVFTLGYPLTDIMGSNAKLTTGIVNSTTGLRDDPRLYQISVEVQAGNSGGPLVNLDGAVVGLVTAKLSAAQVYRWTGDMPQNVNYAVKVSFLEKLLRNGSPAENLPATAGSLQQLAARISPSVVLVIAQ